MPAVLLNREKQKERQSSPGVFAVSACRLGPTPTDRQQEKAQRTFPDPLSQEPTSLLRSNFPTRPKTAYIL